VDTAAAPVRLCDMTESSVRSRVWRNGVLEVENFPFEQISDYLEQPDCVVWVDVCAPDAARLDALAEELSLDAHAVEDAVTPRERPKATHYATHIFITAYGLRVFDQTSHSGAAVEACQISAFAMPNALITVRRDDLFDMQPIVDRWDNNSELTQLGAKALLHGLLDVAVDTYFDCIQLLDDEVESVEDTLFDDGKYTTAEVQKRTFTLRKSLVHTRRVVLPMREVVNTVRRYGNNAAELDPYFDDLYDHVLRASEWSESLRDMITSIYETNLSLADARMNMIMKKLTSWAAIIAVPTAITGFYGQNVPYPEFGTRTGFLVSTGAIVLISFALWLGFRRRDWL